MITDLNAFFWHYFIKRTKLGCLSIVNEWCKFQTTILLLRCGNYGKDTLMPMI